MSNNRVFTADQTNKLNQVINEGMSVMNESLLADGFTTPESLIDAGLLTIGKGVIIEPGCDLCHALRDGTRRPVTIGEGCVIRFGTVLYSGVTLGDECQTGHHVTIREDVTVGPRTVIGTGAVIGSNILLSTVSSAGTKGCGLSVPSACCAPRRRSWVT